MPRWATAYSVAFWPLVWAMTEETTYLGYILPRLARRTGHRWPSVAIVSLAWAVQHVALPLLPDRRYLLARVLSALPITATTTAQFVLLGQLPPLMVAHWLADAPTALLARATSQRGPG
jgi:membrane protease YdiL (CAAX protease family)